MAGTEPDVEDAEAPSPAAQPGRLHQNGDARLDARSRLWRAATADPSLLLVLLLSAAVGAVAIYWFFQHDLVVRYNDAQSHLNIARRVFDSRNPSVAQLGTVWLPVPHILMLPLVASDFLWQTGLAGSIVGLVSFVATAGVLFQSVRLVTRHELAAWIGVLAFVSNPNVLYLQATPMTEPVLMLGMTASAYYLLRWSKRGSHSSLIVGGVLAAVAVGSRYDGWFYAASSAALVLCSEYFASRDASRAEGLTLAYVVIPVYAMFIWFFYNWVIFGDPLEFARGQFSAAYQQEQILKGGGLATKHNAVLSVLAYSWAVMDNMGLATLFLGLAGLLAYLSTTRFRPNSLLPYAFLSPYFFNIIALWMGQTVLNTPQSDPPGYFNTRYGVLMLPAAVVFLAYLADVMILRLRPIAVVLIFALAIGAQFYLWVPQWPTSLITVTDAMDDAVKHRDWIGVAEYLRTNYDGQGILIDDTNSPFLFSTGLPLREYIATFSGELWTAALKNPTDHVGWVVLYPDAPNDRVTAGIDHAKLSNDYRLAFEQNGCAVYRRTRR